MICDEDRQQSIVRYLRERGVASFGGILDFSPCDLWPLIRGKTLWVVGDSHSYDLFHALACFLVQLYDHDYSQDYPYARETEAFNHMEQHVEHYKPPECLPLQEGTMLCQVRVNRGQMVLEHTLPLLQRMAKPSDIAVMNFAHWHNGWEGHEYRDLLQAFRDHVTAHADELPHIVWKQMVPTHYKHLHGAYKGGTPPFECSPLGVQLQPDGSLTPTDELSQLMLEGGAHNKAALEAFAGSGVVITHSWNATAELYEYHRELADGRGHECGHYCFPGVPEMWVYYVYEAIRDAPWGKA
ncbi:g6246 [Coccomyxa elongata]